MGDLPKATPPRWAVIATATIGVVAAAMVLVGHYFEVRKAWAEAARAEVAAVAAHAEAERSGAVANAPKTAPAPAPGPPGVLQAEQPKPDTPPGSRLDPNGTPAGILPGLGKRYFVWRDANGWHVRFTSGQLKHRFNGELRADGGDIISVSPVAAEGASDVWWAVGEGGRSLKFDKAVQRTLEGIDFKVSRGVRRVEFKLRVGGKEEPWFVFVGRQSQTPEAAEFALANSD